MIFLQFPYEFPWFPQDFPVIFPPYSPHLTGIFGQDQGGRVQSFGTQQS